MDHGSFRFTDDTNFAWNFGNRNQYVSLDVLARAFGIPGKVKEVEVEGVSRLLGSKTAAQARRALAHALTYAFRDRKKRKIEFRQIWIVRINALCRQEGITYSRFIAALKKNKVAPDRKSLATIAVSDEATFKKLIEFAKK